MSDPYRTSAGTPCPRCGNVLVEADGEFACESGCGTWLSRKLVETMVTMETVGRSSGNPFKATPLPATKCLVCRKALDDLYKGTVDVLTIGLCLEHGVWLEGGSRDEFEALFAPDIRAQRVAVQEAAELATMDPVDALGSRVLALEREVKLLRQIVDDLRNNR